MRNERWAKPAYALVALLLMAGGFALDRAAAAEPVVIGNERGGKIPGGVDNLQESMKAIVAHCAKFGKKGFITKMDVPPQGSLVVFECLGRH